MTDKASPTLAARLLAVMGEVGYIQKQGKTQSGPSFTYMKHDNVVAALRPAFVKHGVAFLATVRPETIGCVEHSVTKNGTQRYKTTLMLDMTFVNVDEPGDAYNVSFPGEGIDDSDKGSGKALSYATKNGLLKTFMIESGDEADNEAGTQEAAPRPQAARQDQQREQAASTAAPAPNGTITQAQAKRLHEDLYAKGRASKWFLGVIAGKGIGDGEHLTSIPSGEYERLLEIVGGFADPLPPDPTTPAAAGATSRDPNPDLVDVVDEENEAALATQEAAEEVAAPAAASAAPEPAVAAQAAPAAQGGAEDDDGFDVLDDAIKAQAEKTATPEKAKRKATVTAAQLTRLGAQCAELEAQGVGRDEWRLYMMDKEGVSSRTELTKAAATRVIDYLARWLVDLKTGVVGANEGAAA